MYNVAVVGCGRIASLYDEEGKMSHARSYHENKATRIVAACDTKRERAEEFGRKWNVGSVYTDAGKMLEQNSIDILSVCTYADSHLPIIESACKSGVKFIFCEKPLADTLSSAKKIGDICKKYGIGIAVNHSRRWDTSIEKVRQLCQVIDACEFSYCRGIVNTGVHMFDMLRWFCGEVSAVEATGKSGPDISGIAHCSGLDVEIKHEESSVPLKMHVVSKSRSFSIDNTSNQNIDNAVKNIVGWLDNGEELKCTAEDGYRALEISAAFVLSHSEKKAIRLPVKKRMKITDS